MSYSQPYRHCSDVELDLVGKKKGSKVAFIDAISYMHDELCEYASEYSHSVYKHNNYVDAAENFTSSLNLIRVTSHDVANDLQENFTTINALKSARRKSRQSGGQQELKKVNALTDKFLMDLLNEFNRMRS